MADIDKDQRIALDLLELVLKTANQVRSPEETLGLYKDCINTIRNS